MYQHSSCTNHFQEAASPRASGLLPGFFRQNKSRSTIFKRECKDRVIPKQMEDEHSRTLSNVCGGLKRADPCLIEILVQSVRNSYDKCLTSFNELNHNPERCSAAEKNHMRSLMIFFAHVAQGSLPSPDASPTEFILPSVSVDPKWVRLVYGCVLEDFILEVVERAIGTGLKSLDLRPTCIHWWSAVEPLASSAEAGNSSRQEYSCSSIDAHNSVQAQSQQVECRRSDVFKERLCRMITGDFVRILERALCSFFRNRFCAVSMASCHRDMISQVSEITTVQIKRRVYVLRTDPLRKFVKVRPYAWHWYQVYQESICREGGTGRAFDRVQYATEF